MEYITDILQSIALILLGVALILHMMAGRK